MSTTADTSMPITPVCWKCGHTKLVAKSTGRLICVNPTCAENPANVALRRAEEKVAAPVVSGAAPKGDPVRRTRIIEGGSEYRKNFPMAEGLLDYFPDALAAVSEVSKKGNDKHNPGEPMHHARGKSMDHANCIMRHLLERGGFDGDIRHSAALAWRALALLQEELEREYKLPLPRGAKE